MSSIPTRIQVIYHLAPLGAGPGQGDGGSASGPGKGGVSMDPGDRARAVARESTLEVPEGVAPREIEERLLGRVETVRPLGDGRVEVRISHAPEILDGGLPQLLNVIHGNISLLPGVRLAGLSLPETVLSGFPGPRFGIRGIRETAGAPTRPLVASALKPVGLSPRELAAQAAAMARAGVDVIKDDHSLADQASAPFGARVDAVARAVARVNEETGGRTAYYANVTGPVDRIMERASRARDAGAGGLLLSPGLVGLDALRMLAQGSVELPIMSHPSRADVGPERATGVTPEVHFGLLHRLAGADAVVYVNAGGRFAWSVETCQAVNTRLRGPFGDLAPALPVPAGGVDRDRAAHWFTLYGPDVLLLIGGSLLRQADLETAARELVDRARRADPGA